MTTIKLGSLEGLPEEYHVMKNLINCDPISQRESARQGFNDCKSQYDSLELGMDEGEIAKTLWAVNNDAQDSLKDASASDKRAVMDAARAIASKPKIIKVVKK